MRNIRHLPELDGVVSVRRDIAKASDLIPIDFRVALRAG